VNQSARRAAKAGNCGDTGRNTIACKEYIGRAVDDLPGPEDIEHTIPITAGTTAAPADAVYCPAHRSAHLVGVSLTPDGEREVTHPPLTNMAVKKNADESEGRCPES